jgi:hypothetical protein
METPSLKHLKQQHKFCRKPFNEHSYHVWFQFAKWFQRRRLKSKRLQSPTIMGTITKNYIIIVLFEKIIMKKECQYYHHLKHHHHHPVGERKRMYDQFKKKKKNKLAEKQQLVSSQQ